MDMLCFVSAACCTVCCVFGTCAGGPVDIGIWSCHSAGKLLQADNSWHGRETIRGLRTLHTADGGKGGNRWVG